MDCDFIFSLERLWSCDAYRAGDGVHAAWLDRRREFEPAWKGWFRAMLPFPELLSIAFRKLYFRCFLYCLSARRCLSTMRAQTMSPMLFSFLKLLVCAWSVTPRSW